MPNIVVPNTNFYKVDSIINYFMFIVL